MEKKSKGDDYDGDDEEGKTSSEAEEDILSRAGNLRGAQLDAEFSGAQLLQRKNTDVEVDEESKEETIRKLLEETLVSTTTRRESSKRPIDHVQASQEDEEALDKTNVKKSFGLGSFLDKMRSTTSSPSNHPAGVKSELSKRILNPRRTQSLEPETAVKSAREPETAVKSGSKETVQGQRNKNQNNVKGQGKVRGQEQVKFQEKVKVQTNLQQPKRHSPYSRSVFVKSNSVTDPYESAILPLGSKLKISASMSKLVPGVSKAVSSLDVSRRASTGMGHHGGGSTGSFKNFRLAHYDSGNSSLSPSPSPLARHGDADPLTLKRLYLLQRSGTVGSITTDGSGSRLNSSSQGTTNRSASVRSGREGLKRSRRSGRPLVRDPLNYSFYRGCRSNSFAFSMDVKSSAPLKDLPPREQRHRKVGYAIMICSSVLLSLAVLCIVISLHFSSLGHKAAAKGSLNVTTHPTIELRKENEDLLRSIVQTPSSLNVSFPAPTASIPFSTSFPPVPPGGGAPPPESLREPIQTNNIISISGLHVQKHRGTRQTTTKSNSRSSGEAVLPNFRQEVKGHEGQDSSSSKPSSNSKKAEHSTEFVEADRDEAVSEPEKETRFR